MAGCAGSPNSNQKAEDPKPVEPPSAAASVAVAPNAGKIYAASCAECHGDVGEGAEKGISLIKGHALYHSTDDFINRVTNGKKDEMPAFKEKLTEAEIAEVVRFVREEIQGPYLKKKSDSKK